MNLTDRREQRLQSYKKARSEKEIYERVLAPTLYEFVVWVLQEALQSGTKRLYFLARDGYQMYLAARKLCKQYDLDIECRYLKVSRYAVRVPEYHLLGERCLERICVGGIDVTFEKIMQRAALTDKEAQEIAALAGYTENYRKVINYHEVMQLKDRLKKIPLLFHYIDSHSKEAYGTAIGYLTQEGLLEQIPYALVDSGWIGTIQQSIEHLLRQRQPDRKLEGYYFGLYEIPEGERRENYHSFYFTPWGEIKRKVHFSNSLFEAVFSAPEGMTLSYRTEGEKDKIIYVPVTDSRENLNRERISRYICWLEEFLQEKKQSLQQDSKRWEQLPEKNCKCRNQFPQADSGYVEELLSPFMGNPTQFEAEAYGSLLFSDDVREDNNQKVSADFSEQEIKNHHLLNRLLIMTGVRKQVLHESAWIEGSIATCGTLNERGRVRNRWHAVFYKYIIYIRKWIKQNMIHGR
jgi:hypothetical protein